MVHFPALPSPPYVFRWRYDGITRRGFPHSDIPGSKLVCSSPRLIAAYRVLHRLLAPRHSPYALSSLIIGIETDTCRFENRRATVSLPTLTKHCACLWIGKTTVCRIFSCQRATGGLRPAGPLSRSLAGPLAPTPLARGAHSAPKLADTPFGAPNSSPTHRWLASRSRGVSRARRRLVENTGLEPVTSWLQTRRSPS